MKKLFVLFSIVALTSCGGASNSDVQTTDSTVVAEDTTSVSVDSTGGSGGAEEKVDVPVK